MLYQQFYSELGKLLYAIADADKIITKQEKQRLLEMVKNELAPKEKHKDGFDTNAATYTEIEFDIMEGLMADPEIALESFLNYIEDHYTAFDDRIKRVWIRVAKEVANAHQGINEKEKKLLDKLVNKLKTLDEKNTVRRKQKF